MADADVDRTAALERAVSVIAGVLDELIEDVKTDDTRTRLSALQERLRAEVDYVTGTG